MLVRVNIPTQTVKGLDKDWLLESVSITTQVLSCNEHGDGSVIYRLDPRISNQYTGTGMPFCRFDLHGKRTSTGMVWCIKAVEEGYEMTHEIQVYSVEEVNKFPVYWSTVSYA